VLLIISSKLAVQSYHIADLTFRKTASWFC